MELHIGEHHIANLLGYDVHMDTLITLWLSMGIILFISLFAVCRINIFPSKIQSVFEKIVTIFVGLTKNLGKEQGTSALILMSLFLLIIVSNLLGQFPFKIFNLKGWELASPTNDINVTAALAIFVLVYYIIKGIKAKGLSYFKHYFKPVWFMTPFNIMEDFTRPFTLALRLFANILAGEIMVVVLGSLILTILMPEGITSQSFVSAQSQGFFGVLGYNIQLFLGSLLALPVMFFELFVAFIQALVFTLLANAYIQSAVGNSH